MCTVRSKRVYIKTEIPQSSPPINCTVLLGEDNFPCKGSSEEPLEMVASRVLSRCGSYRYELHMTHIVYGQSNKTVNVYVEGQ